MIDRTRLDAYLETVTQRFARRDAHAVLCRFMCRCLLLIHDVLPEVGRRTLGDATAFWLQGIGQSDVLVAGRLDCWRYLDAKHGSTEIRDREDAAMRALLCVLYAEPESDDFSVETVLWFATMLDRLGEYSDEVTRLMET